MKSYKKFRPVKDRILAKLIYEKLDPLELGLPADITQEELSKVAAADSRLAHIDLSKELPTLKADVVAVGKDVEEVETGDTVYFNGKRIPISYLGDKYILFREADVNGIIED